MEHEIAQDESTSQAVMRAVGVLRDRAPEQLQPIGDVLDPDALNSLFRSPDGCSRIGGHISFVYSSCRVTVDHGEYLTVERIWPEPRKASGGSQGSRAKSQN